VWEHRFRQGARRNVRKAWKNDLEIERDSSGRLIPVYRDLLRRSVERWAARSNEPRWLAKLRAARDDPPGKLEYLGRSLGERMVTMVAWFRDEPAAATIILAGNSHFYWRGAMHEELGPRTQAAYALQSAAIEDACKVGAGFYYFGESGQSSGLGHFKERFGAVGHPYREVRFERLPMTRATTTARSAVKRLVGYNAG
jgi:lipid II:glycine glycyltransferase (peptidoglycan interpeptide bridge formation enzyme)